MSMKDFFIQLAILLCSLCFSRAKELLAREEMGALRKKLQQVAGVFSDPTLVERYGLQHTVLVTGCNHGFLNHLYNFDCFAKRLGMKYLVITMDKAAEETLSKHHPQITTFPMTGSDEITSSATEFRSAQFNLITARKKAAVHSIMELGFDVLFSDTDVTMLRDPFPYLIWKNVDYVHSLNVHCTLTDKHDNFLRSKIEGNTGFYYVRSTNATLKLWADAFHAAPKYPRLDDQAVFWKVLRQSQDPKVVSLGMHCRDYDKGQDLQTLTGEVHKKSLVSCVLDTCAFSSGMLSRLYVPEFTYETLLDNLRLRNESAVTIHANYLSGNGKKQARLREHGLWLATIDDDNTKYECATYVPPQPDWKYHAQS